MNTQTPPEAITRALLSGALQKANDAVKADNERDWSYAIEAYVASCDLLRQVMGRVDRGTDEWGKINNIVRPILWYVRTFRSSLKGSQMITYQQRIQDLTGDGRSSRKPSRS